MDWAHWFSDVKTWKHSFLTDWPWVSEFLSKNQKKIFHYLVFFSGNKSVISRYFFCLHFFCYFSSSIVECQSVVTDWPRVRTHTHTHITFSIIPFFGSMSYITKWYQTNSMEITRVLVITLAWQWAPWWVRTKFECFYSNQHQQTNKPTAFGAGLQLLWPLLAWRWMSNVSQSQRKQHPAVSMWYLAPVWILSPV